MSPCILVVDDEPDLEALVLQKFRRQIQNGTIKFLFAHEGVEALDVIKANGSVDLVVKESSGSVENLARLRERRDGVQVALVQGGTANPR